MGETIFVEVKFWLLVIFSLLAPILIYVGLLKKRAISRPTVLFFGLLLVALAGIDVYLMKSLETLARLSASLADDAIFVSEVSVALYVFPIVLGGVGVNLISHVLITHLLRAERQFDTENPRS
ncbi:hypothetical protein [Stenotrophobium rhamnosiphilum]|uniref:Uncharacterized protein n=1 Tax=Stenotrophobium rhamnosiphilum TaxID=2029166 RepID=A0A2T5MCQ5_9GAMM|nr:hypothetical protein [Stenotrophobium rhamnosiphilum]PTU30358.1 hypothetical protein CJD38_15560 [Stenotrophobium rhamnosiphilum]